MAGAVLLAACSSATGTGSTATSGEPVKGGSATMIMVTDVTTFDAAKIAAGHIAGQPGQLLYDHLIYFDKDFKVKPGLALSITPDAVNTVYTIKLRPNVKFSDGTALDAAAVQTHFARVKDKATASPSQPSANEISSMEVADPLTLKVTLAAPDATWIQAFGAQSPNVNLSMIPSPTAVQKYGDEFGKTPETTVGAGPFLLKEWVPGNQQTYVRNPTYWDAPKPYLDSFTIKVIADEKTRYNTFRAGGADIMLSITPKLTLKDIRTTFPTIELPLTGSLVVAMRNDQGPTADPRVRRALVQGADISAAVNRATGGNIEAMKGWFPSDGPFGNDVPLPAYDAERAKADLQDYLRESGKTSVDLTFYGSSNAFTDLATALKQDWDKIPGLKVTVGTEPAAQSVSRMNARNYDGLIGVPLGVTPRQMLPYFLSTSSTNVGFINDPVIDEAVRKANATLDVAAQREALRTLSQRLTEQALLIPLYPTPRPLSYQKNIHGLDLATTITADSIFLSQDIYRAG